MKVLGIDIGGSGIKGAVVNVRDGRLLTARVRLDTPESARPAAVARIVAKLAAQMTWRGPIGLGFPGIIRQQIAYSAPNLHPTWTRLNLARHFTKATKCPACVLNDADAAGVAEMAFGAGRKTRGTVLMLTFGTGIGSALFRDGMLVPNLELGHTEFQGDIAEKYASAAVRKSEDLSWSDWGRRVNQLLHHFHFLLSPDLIIFGGGVSTKFGKFARYFDVATRVVPARMGNLAGIVGAALAASRQLPKTKLTVKSFTPPEENETD